MAKLSGGEALIKSMVREGVEVVFGLPGVQMYGIVAALRDEPSIKFIVTRNETATSYMADGSTSGEDIWRQGKNCGRRLLSSPAISDYPER